MDAYYMLPPYSGVVVNNAATSSQASGPSRSIEETKKAVKDGDGDGYRAFMRTVRELVKQHLDPSIAWSQHYGPSVNRAKQEIFDKHSRLIQQYNARDLIEHCMKQYLGNIKTYDNEKQKATKKRKRGGSIQEHGDEDVHIRKQPTIRPSDPYSQEVPSGPSMPVHDMVPMDVEATSTEDTGVDEMEVENNKTSTTSTMKTIWVVHVGHIQENAEDPSPALTVVSKQCTPPQKREDAAHTISLVRMLCDAIPAEQYSGEWGEEWLGRQCSSWKEGNTLHEENIVILAKFTQHAPHMLKPGFHPLVQAIQRYPTNILSPNTMYLNQLLVGLWNNFPELCREYEDQLLATCVELWQINGGTHFWPNIIDTLISKHSRPVDWLVALEELSIKSDYTLHNLKYALLEIDISKIAASQVTKFWHFMTHTHKLRFFDGIEDVAMQFNEIPRICPLEIIDYLHHLLQGEVDYEEVFCMLVLLNQWKENVDTPEVHIMLASASALIEKVVPTWLSTLSAKYEKHHQIYCINSAMTFMGMYANSIVEHIVKALQHWSPLLGSTELRIAANILGHCKSAAVDTTEAVSSLLQAASKVWKPDSDMVHAFVKLAIKGMVHGDTEWGQVISLAVNQARERCLGRDNHSALQQMLVQAIPSQSHLIGPHLRTADLRAFLAFFKRRIESTRRKGEGEELNYMDEESVLTGKEKTELVQFLVRMHAIGDGWPELLWREGLFEYL